MTEEARDPAADAVAGESEAPPSRPRRRRRRSRGKNPAGGRTAATDASESPSEEPEQAGSGSEEDEQAESGPQGAGQAEPKQRKTPARRRRSTPRRQSPAEEEGDGATVTAAQLPEAEGEPAEDAEDRPGVKETASQKRRRRRRRRRKALQAVAEGPAEDQAAEEPAGAEAAEEPAGAEAAEEAPEENGEKASKAPRARRTRSRRKTTARKPAEKPVDKPAEKTEEKPARKRPAAPKKEASAPAAAARTRTRARDRRRPTTSRRRAPAVVTERRTDKLMLITEHDERVRIAVAEGQELVEHYVTRTGARSMVGNVYLGRVQNVLPGMEAAFVDIGRGRNAVLYAGEVSYDEEVEEGDRRIEQALKPGQSVLVQVTKDPLGGKGARLTAQISLPGRFLVYVPDGGVFGISRRLPDAERRRLRDAIKKIRPSQAGVIVRTAAEGASEEDLAGDLERLKKIWDSIKRKSRRAKAPNTIYEEPELTIRVIRDVFSPAEFQEIVTDSADLFERIRVYLKEVDPGLLQKVRFHPGPLPVFEEYRVLEQIHKALERKVWLPSGGYVVIDRTEAMTVIDVNTGKHVGKSNLEETVVGTNLEAAREIARQLRLRDIGGIIVIDFIDMLLEKNRELVIRTFREALSRDKTRSQVFDITPLGLLEVTRKKVSAGLVESYSETCPTCEGRGILLTHEI